MYPGTIISTNFSIEDFTCLSGKIKEKVCFSNALTNLSNLWYNKYRKQDDQGQYPLLRMVIHFVRKTEGAIIK